METIIKSFKSLKAKYPDVLLLFLCGDFYEAYEEDADKVSEVLNITCTKYKSGFKLAILPYYALDTYLPKLIRAGHRIGMCDNVELLEKITPNTL